MNKNFEVEDNILEHIHSKINQEKIEIEKHRLSIVADSPENKNVKNLDDAV